MSESNRLNINITATNDPAVQKIQQLLGEIKSLDSQLRTITGQMAQYGQSASSAFQKITAGIQQEITARQQQIATIRDSISAMEAAARAAAQERDARVEAALGPSRAMQSAAASARTLATSLSVVAEADGRLRQEAHDTAIALDAERTAMLGLIQARATQTTRIGVPGGPPSGRAGEGLLLTPAAGFRRIVDDLAGVDANLLSARESARVFQQALGPAGGGLTLTSAGGFNKLVADLTGVQKNFKSAEESARVFTEALGPVGANLRLTPSAGFTRIAADLAGVKQNYLSAAASARVFQDAGLTATERMLGMTDASVAAAAKLERATGAAGALGREMRHVVGFFDAIARGQFGQALSSVGAGLRDAGVGAASLGVGIGALVAVMAARGIVHGAESMGKWAVETRAAASAAGMSLASYSQLQGALTLIGLKSTEADSAMRQLSEHIGEAVADPTSRAAEGFHALGISQETLVKNANDLNTVFGLLANAWQANIDGPTKSAAAEAAMGRGFEALVPLLQRGASGIDELKQKAEALGITLNDATATSLTETGQKAEELSATIHGQAIKAFVAWGETIKTLIGLLETLGTAAGKVLELMRGFKEFAMVGTSIPAMIATGRWGALFDSLFSDKPGAAPAAGGGPSGTRTVPPITPKSAQATVIDQMRRDMARAAEEASRQQFTTTAAMRQAEEAAEIGVLERTLQTATLNAKQREEIEKELSQKRIALHNSVTSQILSDQETVMESIRRQMAVEAEAASRTARDPRAARQAELNAEINVLNRARDNQQLTAKERGEIETQLSNKLKELRNSELSVGVHAARQGVRDFIAAEKEKIAEADGSSKKIQAIYEEMLTGLRTKYAATAAQIATIERERVEAVNRARLQEITEGARREQQMMRLSSLNQQLGEIAQHPLGIRQTPEREMESAQRYAAQAQAIRTAADVEIAALKEVESAAAQGSALQRKAAEEILSVEISAKSQEVELYRKAGEAASDAAKRAMEGFTKFFDSVGSSFETFTSSAIKSLIAPQTEVIHAGMTTIVRSMRGSEIKSAVASLFTSVVTSLGRSVEEGVSSFIAKAISGGAANTISELLSQTLGKAFGSIFGSSVGSIFGGAAGGAASAAATSAAIATASTAQIAATTTSTATLLGGLTALGTLITGAIAGQTGILAPLLVATAVKPSILGFSYAEGGIVPSAAGGMVVGGLSNKGILSILHPQEMVLPAPISRGFQEMFSRSQTFQNNLTYSPTINSASRTRSGTGMTRGEFHELMAVHSGALLGEARNMSRNGWRPF